MLVSHRVVKLCPRTLREQILKLNVTITITSTITSSRNIFGKITAVPNQHNVRPVVKPHHLHKDSPQGISVKGKTNEIRIHEGPEKQKRSPKGHRLVFPRTIK
jgi:hypothetical protein